MDNSCGPHFLFLVQVRVGPSLRGERERVVVAKKVGGFVAPQVGVRGASSHNSLVFLFHLCHLSCATTRCSKGQRQRNAGAQGSCTQESILRHCPFEESAVSVCESGAKEEWVNG